MLVKDMNQINTQNRQNRRPDPFKLFKDRFCFRFFCAEVPVPPRLRSISYKAIFKSTMVQTFRIDR